MSSTAKKPRTGTKTLDVGIDDVLTVSGPAVIRLVHKSGRCARLSVTAALDAQIELQEAGRVRSSATILQSQMGKA